MMIYGGVTLAGVVSTLGVQAVMERLNPDQRAKMGALYNEIENLKREHALNMTTNANNENQLIGLIANKQHAIRQKKMVLELEQMCTKIALGMLETA